jgi:hypothetical protein
MHSLLGSLTIRVDLQGALQIIKAGSGAGGSGQDQPGIFAFRIMDDHLLGPAPCLPRLARLQSGEGILEISILIQGISLRTMVLM